MDALSATAATAAPITAASGATSTTDPTPSAPATDASTTKKSFSALLTEAKQDLKSGEHLTKVDGHPFARIKGGERDAMCVNLSGNVRNGQAFDLISRGGHQFHVYGGSGADRVVVEVGRKAAATPTPAADGTTTTGTTTTGTTTTGTTTTDTGATGSGTSAGNAGATKS